MPAAFSTLAVAAAGVALFAALGLPLPFLLGPMFACLAAALAGMRPVGSPRLSNAMRTVLGIAVGASVTPELVGRIGAMAASVALVPLFVAAAGLVGAPYYRRVAGFDAPTAYYAAMPGGLQDMVLFGAEAGGDMRALALVHVTRVLAIVSVAPALMDFYWGVSLSGAPGAPASSIPVIELALMLYAAWIGWKWAERVGLFGAPILGPIVTGAMLSLSGLIGNRPPAEALMAAQFFIGIGIGGGYAGVTARELRRVVAAALGHCVILGLLSILFAEAAHRAGLAPEIEALLAFAPGGQAEMVLLAIVAGVDAAYVATHHLIRVVVVITGAPIAARLMRVRAAPHPRDANPGPPPARGSS